MIQGLKQPKFNFSTVIPFFLSAILFLSGFFLVFAPLPLLVYYFYSSFRRFLLACGSNLVLAVVLSGWLGAGLFFTIGILPVLGIVLFLFRIRFSIEKTVSFTLIGMVLFSVVGAGVGSYFKSKSIREYVDSSIDQSIHYMENLSRDPMQKLNRDEIKSKLKREIPSMFLIFGLIILWVNLTIIVRINPKHLQQQLKISPAIFKNWKAPELLIWPTILSAGLMLFTESISYWIGLNFFRVFMAIYAIQGLSIVSYALDHWKVAGMMRTLCFLILVFFLMPFLLGLGFFDLWFDFRKKLGQSYGPKDN